MKSKAKLLLKNKPAKDLYLKSAQINREQVGNFLVNPTVEDIQKAGELWLKEALLPIVTLMQYNDSVHKPGKDFFTLSEITRHSGQVFHGYVLFTGTAYLSVPHYVDVLKKIFKGVVEPRSRIKYVDAFEVLS